MKIEKTIETCVDVTVDVDLEDIVCAISESRESTPLILRGINNAHTFLKAIPDEKIAEMNEKQKRTIYDAMLLQVQRYAVSASGEQP